MTTLADAANKLKNAQTTISKAKTTLAPNFGLPRKQDSRVLQKKVEEMRKQVALAKQSNADVFSDVEGDSRSSSESYSSEEDDFIDRGCAAEKKGPFADLSPSHSGYSDDDDEDDENNNSMTLDSDSEKEIETPRAAKRPLSSEELKSMHIAQQENEKRRRLNEEGDSLDAKEKRLIQINTTIKNNIKGYENLRLVVNDALLKTQQEIAVLEEKEKSCSAASVFVLDQGKVAERERALVNEEAVLEEKKRAFELKCKEREAAFIVEQESKFREREAVHAERERIHQLKCEETKAAVERFTQESDRKLEEYELKRQELEKKEKALATTPTQPPQQQQQLNLNKSGSAPNNGNNLDAFISEMYRANQNTITKEMFNAIVPPALITNMANMAFRYNNAPTSKTYSSSNSQFILIDIQGADGVPLFRQVVSKQLYNIK